MRVALLLLLLLAPSNAVARESRDYSMRKLGERDRDRPDKEAPDCANTNYTYTGDGDIPPCRDPYDNQDGSGSKLPTGESEGGVFPPPTDGMPAPAQDPTIGGGGFPTSPDANEVEITVYMRMKAWQASKKHALVSATVAYLNETLQQNNFLLGENFNDRRLNAEDHPIHSSLQSGPSGHRKLQLGGDSTDGIIMTYDYTSSQIKIKLNQTWWWQYKMRFLCTWLDASPVLEGPLLDMMQTKVHEVLNAGVADDSFRQAVIQVLGDTNVALRMNISDVELEPVEDSIVGDDNNNNTVIDSAGDKKDKATFSSYIDVTVWDWRRYLGLGMFSTVFLGTLLLVAQATRHQRRLHRQEHWGDLVTEKGVDELLKLGWKLEHNGLQVYKIDVNEGYQEGDSMLIGGFEQHEPGVGSEISFPRNTDTALTGTNTISNETSSKKSSMEDHCNE